MHAVSRPTTLTEAVALISSDHVPHAGYNEAKWQFGDEELVELVHSIATINTWNRFAITFRDLPGAYEPSHFATGACWVTDDAP